MKENSTALARSLVVGLAVLVAAPGQAAKPGGGGGGGGGGTGGGSTPQGTIYYYGNFPGWNGTPTISMNADGTGAKVVGDGTQSRIFGEPTLNLHNNHRWFYSAEYPTAPTYPDGSWRKELVALRDDYYNPNSPQAETRAHLIDDITEDPTLQLTGAHWLLGDDAISFIGRRWSSTAADATVVEGGIYTAPVVFDADGNIAGLGELPTSPTIPMRLGTGDYPWPDLIYYSWDPTGTMIVYQKSIDPYGIWVGDISGGETKISSVAGHMPEWSPDGRTIVFGSGGGFYTMKPNGKSVLWIVRARSDWDFFHAFWSPDSKFLVFTGQSTGSPINNDLFLVSANGGDLIHLTDTPDQWEKTSEFYAGWR